MKAFQYLTVIFLCCFFGSVSSFAQTSYKVTAERLNVKNKPSSQALVVGVINRGEIILVSEIISGWASIPFKGKTRYIDAKYIEKIGNSEESTKTKDVSPTKPKEDVEPSIIPTPTKLSDFKQERKRKGKKVKEEVHKENKKRIHSNGELHLIADVFGGYSNFMCDEVTPEFGIGFGGDVGLQCDYSKLWGKLPQSFYGEITLGYAYRGSGAFPIHYAEARICPIGYKYSLNSDLKLIGKVGMYVAYPFSELETNSTSYSTSVDFGISGGIGVEWKKFGLMATYEHGFADVKGGGRVELYNQGAFLTLSYKIKTFK